MRDYTETELCETVFFLSRYAECLEIDKVISVPDERELFGMLFEWAQNFERTFDPGSGKDHMSELECRGPKWLLETFPYMPELDEERRAIIDFINFEDETAVIWPWAVSADEIIQNSETLRKVEKAVVFDRENNFDTDELYHALDRIVGINPALDVVPEANSGMIQPSM